VRFVGRHPYGAGVSEAEAIDLIRALEELRATAAAAQARLTAHLHSERTRRDAAAGTPARQRCAGQISEWRHDRLDPTPLHPPRLRCAGRHGLTPATLRRPTCNYTKDLPGWTATLHTRSDGSRLLDLTSPTSHRHRSHAPAPPGAPDASMARLRSILSAA